MLKKRIFRIKNNIWWRYERVFVNDKTISTMIVDINNDIIKKYSIPPAHQAYSGNRIYTDNTTCIIRK